MIKTLVAGGHANRFTVQDAELLAREGCGVCESAKMRRRSFTPAKALPVAKAPIGKVWAMDQLSLRVPTTDLGY
eukprot:1309748-Prymnesium_polylepis.1